MSHELKSYIREIPDFPKPGILFYDITTLLIDPLGLRKAIHGLMELVEDTKIDKIVGIESRGFILGPVVAYELNVGFVPVRKVGKLPAETRSQSYDLEYGSDTVEVHADAIQEGDKVLILDDLIATGGTARATADLISGLGGDVVAVEVLIELVGLEGRAALEGYRLEALLQY